MLVKNNDIIGAYKKMMKLLQDDFKLLKERREFVPNSKARKLKSQKARIRRKKEQKKRDAIFEKMELRAIVDSKKRAKQYKAQQQQQKK